MICDLCSSSHWMDSGSFSADNPGKSCNSRCSLLREMLGSRFPWLPPAARSFFVSPFAEWSRAALPASPPLGSELLAAPAAPLPFGALALWEKAAACRVRQAYRGISVQRIGLARRSSNQSMMTHILRSKHQNIRKLYRSRFSGSLRQSSCLPGNSSFLVGWN